MSPRLSKGEFLYLMCACAGPMMPSELPPDLSKFAEVMVVAKRLSLLRQGYVALDVPRLSQLRELLTPSLKASLYDVESRRSASHNRRPEFYRGRARLALVLGQDALFLQLYGEYGGENQEGWHPDRSHRDFWDEVMGVDLLDSQVLPPSAARNDLLYHVVKRYCLGVLPEVLPALTPPFLPSDVLVMAYCYYLKGDQDQLMELQLRFPGVLLLHALQALLKGDRELAHVVFLESFGLGPYGAMLMDGRREDFLLPLALQNACALGVGQVVVDCWYDYALQTLLNPLIDKKAAYEEAALRLTQLVQTRGTHDGAQTVQGTA